MKTILKISAFVLLLFSLSGCYKHEGEYYKKQAHDPDLIGIWELTNGHIFEYNSDCYIYSYGLDKEGHMQKRKYMLWYTKDNVLYRTRSSSIIYNATEYSHVYWFSDDKTELWMDMGTTIAPYHYIRVESVE